MKHNPTTTIPPALRLDAQLCFAVHSASHAIDQLYRPRLEAHDLTYSQYITLMALAEEDQISITALARRMGWTKATMTPLLRKLEEKALILRTVEPGNERQKTVSLTPSGLNALSGSCHVTDKVFAETGLTFDEAQTLIALCKRIAR